MAMDTAPAPSDLYDELDSPTQSALIIQSSGDYVLSQSAAIPTLTPTTILVRVRAISIQPVDAKMAEMHGPTLDGCVGGYDFAGVVVAVGAGVQRQHEQSGRSASGLLRLHDRVAGMVFGGNLQQPGVGAFCELVLADPRFAVRIPDAMSFEQGAALGTALATAGMALYQSLGLHMPALGTGASLAVAGAPAEATGEWVLVLGGSSSCGTMAIQMLKLSGYKVISTASSRNFQLVKSYGADLVVDYNSPNYIAEIKRLTNNSLSIALDCVSDGDNSMKTCYDAIGSSGGKYTGLNPFPMQSHTREDVKPHWVFVLTMFGQPILIKGPLRRVKPRPKDVEFEVDWWGRAQRLLDQGLIRPHPVKLSGQGLQQAIEGINEVRLCKVSGEKLVYQV